MQLDLIFLRLEYVFLAEMRLQVALWIVQLALAFHSYGGIDIVIRQILRLNLILDENISI